MESRTRAEETTAKSREDAERVQEDHPEFSLTFRLSEAQSKWVEDQIKVDRLDAAFVAQSHSIAIASLICCFARNMQRVYEENDPGGNPKFRDIKFHAAGLLDDVIDNIEAIISAAPRVTSYDMGMIKRET